jgi:hypothetical protein
MMKQHNRCTEEEPKDVLFSTNCKGLLGFSKEKKECSLSYRKSYVRANTNWAISINEKRCRNTI